MAATVAEAKRAVRRALLDARRARTAQQRDVVEAAITAHLLALAPVARAARVAAYRSMADEPGTAPLLEGLAERGCTVLLPITLEDGALDWAEHTSAGPTHRSALGVEEPTSPRLGTSALADVDVVVLPALAVDHEGHRLGRGAGYYDRALAALPTTHRPVLVALVHADELLPTVPHEAHDVPVDVVVTENGVFRVP